MPHKTEKAALSVEKSGGAQAQGGLKKKEGGNIWLRWNVPGQRKEMKECTILNTTEEVEKVVMRGMWGRTFDIRWGKTLQTLHIQEEEDED